MGETTAQLSAGLAARCQQNQGDHRICTAPGDVGALRYVVQTPRITSIASGMATHPILWCASPARFNQETLDPMAKESETPALTKDDIAALLEILRDAGRPMSTDELAAALKAFTTDH